MSYLVIARKYRPQTFEEVVGQGHVTQTLKNAVRQDRIAHAYLFSGPRGVGKTTIARILAKALNCEKGPTPDPCNQCPMCRGITDGSVTDVYEIDGASNTGVDDIRELRENVRYLPSAGRYNIYIIDEVHMLSINAFNALLKILEEPPAHVVFIFATTEPHKIPVTILSRTQRFDFRRIGTEKIEKRIHEISEREGVAVTKEAAAVIAREAGGSMRDAQSLLDQVIGYAGQSITEEAVREVLGLTDRTLLFRMVGALAEHDPSLVVYLLSEVYNQGYDIVQYYRELVDLMRNQLLIKVAPTISTPDLGAEERQELAALSEALSIDEMTQVFNILFSAEYSIKTSSDPRIALELVLIKMTRAGSVEPISEVIERLSRLEGQGFVTSAADTKTLAFDFSSKPPADGHREKGAESVKEEGAPYTGRADAPPVDTAKGFLSYLSGKDPVTHSYLAHAVSIDIEADRAVISLPRKYLHLVEGQEKTERIRGAFRDYFKKDLLVSLVGVEGSGPEPPAHGPIPDESQKHDPASDLLESGTAKGIQRVFSGATVKGYTPPRK
jgi:DNA polymerase-3 subunit gamma/tau